MGKPFSTEAWHLHKGDVIRFKDGSEHKIEDVQFDPQSQTATVAVAGATHVIPCSRMVTIVTCGTRGCGQCGGKGIYYGRGYVENGVFKGFTGPCFACGGKGKQNDADVRRNWYYWNHVYKIAI